MVASVIQDMLLFRRPVSEKIQHVLLQHPNSPKQCPPSNEKPICPTGHYSKNKPPSGGTSLLMCFTDVTNRSEWVLRYRSCTLWEYLSKMSVAVWQKIPMYPLPYLQTTEQHFPSWIQPPHFTKYIFNVLKWLFIHYPFIFLDVAQGTTIYCVFHCIILCYIMTVLGI